MKDSMVDIVFVIGTRPQYIKSSILINHLINQGRQVKVIDTGQHYDENMSAVFLRGLKLPDVINLGVGSASHGVQTARIIIGVEKELIRLRPKFIMIVGDTNSTLGAAIASSKLGYKIGHLEGGLRSGDMSVPEEVNRIIADILSDAIFCPSFSAYTNLVEEGRKDGFWNTGDVMYDVLLKHLPIANRRFTLARCDIDYDYALATVHHHFNTDNPRRLKNILDAFEKACVKVVFPIHPRTRKMMGRFAIRRRYRNIKILSPFGYHDMLNLIRNSEFVITDSGGLQKEAFWLRKPCITLKKDTVWIETVEQKANRLVDVNKKKDIIRAINNHRSFPRRIKQPYGKGKASETIIQIIEELLLC